MLMFANDVLKMAPSSSGAGTHTVSFGGALVSAWSAERLAGSILDGAPTQPGAEKTLRRVPSAAALALAQSKVA